MEEAVFLYQGPMEDRLAVSGAGSVLANGGPPSGSTRIVPTNGGSPSYIRVVGGTGTQRQQLEEKAGFQRTE